MQKNGLNQINRRINFCLIPKKQILILQKSFLIKRCLSFTPLMNHLYVTMCESYKFQIGLCNS